MVSIFIPPMRFLKGRLAALGTCVFDKIERTIGFLLRAGSFLGLAVLLRRVS